SLYPLLPEPPLFPYTTLFRSARRLAGVDPALRHLPRRQPGRHVDAPADKDQALGVEQHDADAGPIKPQLAVGQAHRAALAPLPRSEEHTSELQSLRHLVCRLL